MTKSDVISCDVLVIGAGPTGLMATYLLKRRGIDVRVIDKRAAPSAESRAGVMSSRSVELFASLGLADRVFAHGVPNSDFDIFVGGKRAGGFHFDHAHADDTPFRFITMIPQAGTEAVLIEALFDAGLAVDRGVEATGFRDEGDTIFVESSRADGSALLFRPAICSAPTARIAWSAISSGCRSTGPNTRRPSCLAMFRSTGICRKSAFASS